MAPDIYATRVRDIMTTDLVSLHPQETIHEALEIMVDNKVSAVPVVDRNGRCLGILSTTDLLNFTRDVDVEMDGVERSPVDSRPALLARLIEELGDQQAHDVMTETVATVSPETDIAEAASLMLRNRVHRLPVTDDRDRVQGIVSMSDILGAFVAAAPL